MSNRNEVAGLAKGVYYKFELYNHNIKTTHYRTVYGVIDLLGDIGGILEIITIFFSIFISSIAEHAFNVKAMKLWYLAKTQKDLF